MKVSVNTTLMVKVMFRFMGCVRTRSNNFFKINFRVRYRLRVVDRPELVKVLLTILGFPKINVKIRCSVRFRVCDSIGFICNICVRVRCRDSVKLGLGLLLRFVFVLGLGLKLGLGLGLCIKLG